MIIKPFRNELKYVIHHSTRELLLSYWNRYITRAAHTNEYGFSPVLSQYYDSPDFAFVREKREGLRSRNKVRLRVYGTRFSHGMLAFLEIKRRHNDKVKKFRRKIESLDPESHMNPDNWQFFDEEAAAEFGKLREIYRLRPSAQTYYQREAYEGVIENDVRLTFDSHLIGLYPGERLSTRILRDRSRNVMPDTVSILEIKSTHGFPSWIYNGIKLGELHQQPIPKYTSAVKVLGLMDSLISSNYA